MQDSDNPASNASDVSDTSPPLPTPAEACRLAQNLATRRGYAVFPVREDKTPRLKEWQKHACRDPAGIAQLWRQCPDPLVGIATGAASGVWVLDIDVKHQTAIDWWHLARTRLLPTLVYRTRSGGLHCYYRDGGEQRNNAGLLARGVDVRGNGGYVVSWFCAGYECLEHADTAPWPAWLAQLLARPVAAVAGRSRPVATGGDGSLRGILDKLAGAQEGDRNGLLFWAACRLYEKGMKQAEVERLLLPVAIETGLADPEARRSILSAADRH